jgi:hypothetical protein
MGALPPGSFLWGPGAWPEIGSPQRHRYNLVLCVFTGERGTDIRAPRNRISETPLTTLLQAFRGPLSSAGAMGFSCARHSPAVRAFKGVGVPTMPPYGQPYRHIAR